MKPLASTCFHKLTVIIIILAVDHVALTIKLIFGDVLWFGGMTHYGAWRQTFPSSPRRIVCDVCRIGFMVLYSREKWMELKSSSSTILYTSLGIQTWIVRFFSNSFSASCFFDEDRIWWDLMRIGFLSSIPIHSVISVFAMKSEHASPCIDYELEALPVALSSRSLIVVAWLIFYHTR